MTEIMRNIDSLPATYSQIPASPVGHADRPLFIRQISHEEQTDHAELYFQTADDATLPAVFTVGREGLQVYATEADFDEGRAPIGNAHRLSTMPPTGWRPVYVRCDQTGGMCMVDVVVFENGVCVTITDEVIVMHENLDHWDEGECDDDATAYVWIC